MKANTRCLLQYKDASLSPKIKKQTKSKHPHNGSCPLASAASDQKRPPQTQHPPTSPFQRAMRRGCHHKNQSRPRTSTDEKFTAAPVGKDGDNKKNLSSLEGTFTSNMQRNLSTLQGTFTSEMQRNINSNRNHLSSDKFH